jgi:hypothetical protein
MEQAMNNEQLIEDFGEMVIHSVVDAVFNLYDHDLKRSVKSEASETEMCELLAKLSPAEVGVLKKIALSAIKTTTHYFLWQAEQKKLDIVFQDANVADLSDGLSGELYLEDGWFAHFSKANVQST